jgi:hypothetical protein
MKNNLFSEYLSKEIKTYNTKTSTADSVRRGQDF